MNTIEYTPNRHVFHCINSSRISLAGRQRAGVRWQLGEVGGFWLLKARQGDAVEGGWHYGKVLCSYELERNWREKGIEDIMSLLSLWKKWGDHGRDDRGLHSMDGPRGLESPRCRTQKVLTHSRFGRAGRSPRTQEILIDFEIFW